MATLLIDVANRLEADGVGGGSDTWVIKKGYTTPNPDQQIGIRETGGPRPGSESVESYGDPSFQIEVRGAPRDYQSASEKMEEVFASLHEGDLGARYVDCRAAQPIPFFLGFDDNERPRLTLNFTCMRVL